MGLARSPTVLNLNSCDALGRCPASCLSPAKACPAERASFEMGAQILRDCAQRAGLRPGQLWGFLSTITFVRRESTGPGGPDLVFQHQGAWAMRAYARAATRPRGTVIAQVPPPILFAVLCHALPAM